MPDKTLSRFLEIILNIFSVVFLLAGAYMAVPSLKFLYKIQNAQLWQSVEGTIISADVEQKFIEEAARGQEYVPKVWYSYKVGNAPFLSDRFSFADEFTPNRSAVLKIVSDLPAGKKVKVFYDTTEPSFAVLARLGVPWKDCVLAGLGSFFAVAGLISFLGIFSRRRAG